MRAFARVLALLALVEGPAAFAQYEGGRRVEVDAGVHVPQLTKPPKLLNFVQATYPPEAQQQGLTASVRLKVTIAADGTVSDAEVAEPVGNGFDEAAVEAVKQFTFSPAEIDDVPSPVQIEYVYHFTLEPPDAGVPEAVDAGPPPLPHATLKGQVIARGDRKRIGGATVRCADDPEQNSAVTDEDGQFTLVTVAGVCKLKVAASDYKPFDDEDQELKENETIEVVLRLTPSNQVFETTVRAQRDQKEVVRRTLDREEIQKVPGSFGDPVRVIQDFPGVARAPFISGQLIVRGADPSQTLTFMDGVEIPLLFHFGGGPSVVNSEFLDHIDFYPGGFGSEYGRAIGGVVDVATRKGSSDTYHGSVNINLEDSSVFLEAPITDGVSISGAVRRSYIDALLPLVLPKNPEGGTLLVLPVYWDYQVRLDGGPKRGSTPTGGTTHWSVMAFGSDDLLKVVATGAGMNRDFSISVHTLFHRIVGSYQWHQNDVTVKISPYVGYDLASLDFGIAHLDAATYTAGLRNSIAVDLDKHLTTRFGADLFYTRIGGSAELPAIGDIQYPVFPGASPKVGTQRIAEDLDSFDGALFFEADVKIGDLTITPGFRASSTWLGGKQLRHAFDPRLFARYQLFKGTTIKASIGEYTQPPAVTSVAGPPFGTPGLLNQHAFQTQIGVAQKITDNINVDVTGFYNRRYDMVVQGGSTTQPDGTVVNNLYSNDGLGRAYGLEVLLRHEVTRNFFGWLAYTFSRSEERISGTGNPYVLGQYDQTHILTLLGSYKLPWGFEVGARFRYVTGNPITPVVHTADLYSVDGDSYGRQNGMRRSARDPDFNQLDIRIDKIFVFDKWKLDLFLDVQNVYNQKNVEGYFYDYRFRQAFEVPGIPFLPVLGVKGTF